MSTLRLRLDLAYDGTAFSGWARQPGLRTVEGVLTEGLETILRSPDLRLTVAGRTDAGVHARGQVAHVDVDSAAWAALPGRSGRPSEHAAVTRLAGVLPEDVHVRAVSRAPHGFDARFSAHSRRYVYRLADGPEGRDPIRRADVVWRRRPLDAAAMQAAAAPLLGEHDFLSFCKPREGATTRRELRELSPLRIAPGRIETTVVADAFCHSMVRSVMGALLAVGEGRRPIGWPAELLAARTRQGAAPVAEARGLTLEEICYSPADQLADRARAARARRDQGGVDHIRRAR